MASPSTPPRTNTLALVGFITAFVIPIAGLALGIVAMNQIRRPGNIEEGRGFARWAMIIGALGTAVQVIFFVVWFIVFFQVVGTRGIPGA